MPAPSVDPSALNDELAEMITGFGWTAENESELEELNELTLLVAGWIETKIARKERA